MSSSVRIQTERWLKTIDVKADRVLDIGGAELPVKKRTKSWDVGEYKILDMEKPHEDNAPVDIVFDMSEDRIYSSDDEPHKYKEYFDIAFAIEIFEHCWNPAQAIYNAGAFLKQNGVLYATFPFIYPHHCPTGQDYIRYTKWGVEMLLQKTGFGLIDMQYRQSERGSLRGYYAQEQMRPNKAVPELHEVTGFMIKARKR